MDKHKVIKVHPLWMFFIIVGYLFVTCETICPAPSLEGASFEGVTQLTYDPGTTIRLKCMIGYSVSDGKRSIQATCQTDGTWDYSAMCEVVNCPFPSRARIRTSARRNRDYVVGDTVTFTCFSDSEVQAPGPAGTLSFDVTCEAQDGRFVWLPDWTCGKRTCESVPTIANASNSYVVGQPNGDGHFEIGTVVRVVCDIGRRSSSLYNSKYDATCGNDGKWSPNFPPCDATISTPLSALRRLKFSASLTNHQYQVAFSSDNSQEYLDLTKSLAIAMDQCFSDIYGKLYLGSEDYSFSADDGNDLAFETILVFEPFMVESGETIISKFEEKIKPNSFKAFDPSGDPPTEYIFRQSSFDATSRSAGITFSDGSCIVSEAYTKPEMVGLGLMGAFTALLGLMLCACCCLRTNCCAPYMAAANRMGPRPVPIVRGPMLSTHTPFNRPDILCPRDPPPAHFGLFRRPITRMRPTYSEPRGYY